MPTDYPFKPPKIIFCTKIFHPLISLDGTISTCCFPVLGKEWSPAITLTKVMLVLISYVSDPYPCLAEHQCPDGKWYGKDFETFKKIAKEWAIKYDGTNIEEAPAPVVES